MAIAALILGHGMVASCSHSSTETYYGNDQILYVGQGESVRGDKEGVWVHFNEDGSIMNDLPPQSGRPRWRTGYYEAGIKTRELTADELLWGQQEAARKMSAMKARRK